MKTTETCRARMAEYDKRAEKEGGGVGQEAEDEMRKERHLALMNASEVTVPRYVKDLIEPPELEKFEPRSLQIEHD